MPQKIIMPKTGMAMEEGTIVRWLKREGDTVIKGEAIAEIETDKVTMDLEAEASGVLLKITRRDGETVPATETIAWLGEAGESVTDGAAAAKPAPTAAAAPRAVVTVVPTPAAVPAVSGRIAATPAAKRLAAERGIALASVPGSGPYGAVRLRDLDGAAAPIQSHGAASALHCTVDVTDLQAMVKRLASAGGRLTVMDFIRKASTLALPALGLDNGDSFAIVDLSAFGVTSFTPPLVHPRTAVLGVGSAEQGLRLSGGRVEARTTTVMSVSHALGPQGTMPAAAFLSRLRMLLENPVVLLV